MINRYGRGLELARLDADAVVRTRRAAVLAVCARARDAADATVIMNALGLDPRVDGGRST